jgi:hypothetical protein
VLTIYVKPGAVIPLGREGENNARRIVFDLKPFEEVFGPGVAQLIVRRSGEGVPYPVALELEGSHVAWTVNSADTAIPGRYGEAELRYMVGDTLAKSERWQTTVIDALGTPSETPPEQQQGWLDKVLSAAAKVEEAEAVVREVNNNPPKVIGDTWWVWSIDESAYVDTYVSAVGPVGPEGPTGPKGDQGIAGPAGEDGYTPQKGVDYWTEADKQEIVDYVVQNVPVGSFLPEVSEEENGMVLRVVDGEWAASKGGEEDTEERLTELESQMADLLYKAISITSFTHNAGTKEMGDTVTAVTLSWSINKQPKSLTLDGEALSVNLVKLALSDLSITKDNNKTWTLKATDERVETSTKTTTISFQNGIYCGGAALPEAIDSAFIMGLANKTLTGTKNRTVTIAGGDGKYAWYAYPKRLGTSLFNIGGFDYEYELTTISFTNKFGFTEDYYVYRSGQYAPASLSVTVKNGG